MPATVAPIQESDLKAVGEFLHEHLNRRISAQAWVDSVTHPWSVSRPNFGMQLRDDGKIVGIFLAIYSEQAIDGKPERFCNPHSWCVLEAYRSEGVNLLVPLIRQRGYHFTMLTPNPNVAEIFRHFKFKDLDREIVVFPNLALPFGNANGTIVEADSSMIAQHLAGETARDFALHREIRWLHFVAFGVRDDVCLVAYKPETFKKLPCARLLYVSDAAAFNRHAALLKRHLLFAKGLPLAKIERRFLARRPRFSYRLERTQAKLFLSATLRDSQIKDFYTELASLDV